MNLLHKGQIQRFTRVLPLLRTSVTLGCFLAFFILFFAFESLSFPLTFRFISSSEEEEEEQEEDRLIEDNDEQEAVSSSEDCSSLGALDRSRQYKKTKIKLMLLMPYTEYHFFLFVPTKVIFCVKSK